MDTDRGFWRLWRSVLRSRIPWIVLVTWTALYGTRPFSLGFYSDDWRVLVERVQSTSVFSLARWEQLAAPGQAYAARPGAGVIVFAASSVAAGSPFLYQAISALLALLAALSLRSWLAHLAPPGVPPIAAELAAALWLALPWSLAVTAWPVCAMAALPAQILLVEAARRMTPGEGSESRRLLLVTILLLASSLTYEAFYFQGILLALFALLRDPRSGLRRYGILLAAFAAQALSIFWNRAAASFSPRTSKALALDWQRDAWMSLRQLPRELFHSAAPFGAVLALFCGLIVAAAAAAVVVLLFRSEREGISTGLGLAGLGVTAIPVCCMVYALAGYRIASNSFASRTLAGVSWAISIMVAGLLSTIVLTKQRQVVVTGLGSALLLLAVSGMAQQLHEREFSAVWREERMILRHAPVEQIRALPQDARVLYIGPTDYGSTPVFGAAWELTGALYSIPALRESLSAARHSINFHPATAYCSWSWDGTYLTQQLPGYWTTRFGGDALYVWQYDERRIAKAERGFRWNPSVSHDDFQEPSQGGPDVTAAATFAGLDNRTRGEWGGVYGIDGFSFAGSGPRLPAYAKVRLIDPRDRIWNASTTEERAPAGPSGLSATAWWTPYFRWVWERRRTAAGWWSPSAFTIDLDLTDGVTHRVAIYCVDWGSDRARTEKIEVLDTAGRLLAMQTVSSFRDGRYVLWNLRGHVRLQVTRVDGPGAVASGVLFR